MLHRWLTFFEFSFITKQDGVQIIKRANKTIKNLCWFQVVETRGNIEKGKVHHWQVTVKIGFAVKD
jgi:dodecin